MIELHIHPDFQDNKDAYILYRDLYDGKDSTLKKSKYLWLHELETTPKGAKIRQIREQRSSYTNFIEPIVSIWTSLFFKKEPTIDEDVKTLLGDEINDIDGRGNSLFTFIRSSILQDALIYGRPAFRVSVLGEKPQLKSEQQDARTFRPYFQRIDPMSVVDWQRESNDPARLNQLNFLRLEYEELRQRASAEDAPSTIQKSKQYILIGGDRKSVV